MFDRLVQFPLIKSLFLSLVKSDADRVFLVGGVVRDFILSGSISRDIDVATSLSVEEIVERLPSIGNGKILTNAVEYGSVSFFIDGYSITVTKFRRDVKTFGRSAIVESVESLKTDASRRDFTINALYVDSFGVLTDFFGGIEDLRSGTVRFIGDAGERIVEDYLRILRFFRFSSRFTNEYLDDVLVVISAMANGLGNVSLERITMEMREIVQNKFAVCALKKMHEFGVLKTIFGHDFILNYEVFENFLLKYRGADFYATGSNLGLVPFFLAIVGVSLDGIFSKLSFSNAEKTIVKMAIENSDLLLIEECSSKEFFRAIRLCHKNKDFYTLLGLNTYVGKLLQVAVDGYVKMPINGVDVLTFFQDLDKSILGDVLDFLQLEWISCGYKLSAQELLMRAGSFLNYK